MLACFFTWAVSKADSPLAQVVVSQLLLALVVLFHPVTIANTVHGQLTLCGGGLWCHVV